ncbi:MAG: NAD(P)-dependent oxidoreductase [Candidatus Scalindua sp.]|jgi:dTDP-4-dehydrorhamnose reductase|nr:NAD(P)-dependent oxidoreductase [Candidatus Scalindua sp.]
MKISQDKKVFIAGCGGMLGKAVYEQFAPHCQVLATDIDLNVPWLEYGDVIDFQKILEKASKFEPDLIINLAALTDLEYCEKNPEIAWKTNALGAENMALISKRLNAIHVYISTAGIFDGKQEYYNDFEQPNPQSVYAKAKYYGEISVERMLGSYFVFRAGWMMGGGYGKDKKFISKIFKQILAGKKELFVVNDKLGTPTYTVNFAESLFEIVQTELFGLYNMVCDGSCSRYDVAVEFIRLLGLEKEIKIDIVDSDYFKNEYFAPRPHSEKLINLKLSSRGVNYMKDWRICLEDYAESFKPLLGNQQ